jgi:hypothetical protein
VAVPRLTGALPPSRGAAPERDAPSGWPAVAIGAAGLATAVVVVGAAYLWAYGSGRFATPIGFDTPQVIWRANLVAESGLGALVGWAPPELTVHGDRTGVLVFAALLDGLFGIEPYRLMFSLPAIASVIVALAAGGFAIGALEEPPWTFGVYAIGVGASTHMARIAVGSHDNAFVMGMLVALALTALLAAAGRPAIAGSIVLSAGAALAHWRFAVLFLPVLMALAIVLLPGSLRRWKAGAPLGNTPSARLGLVLAGGAAAGAASMLMAPESLLRIDAGIHIHPGKLAAKTSSRLTPLRLPVTVTAAVAGAVSSWWPRSSLRRWAVITMVVWAASVLVAAAAYLWLDQPVPVYRVAAYALGVPMLAAAFVVGAGRSVWSRLGAPGTALAGLAIVAALAWTTAAAGSLWDEETPLMTQEKVLAMSGASAYLDRSSIDRPVIFLVSTPRLVPTLRQVYAGVPPRLITRTRVFVGTLPDLLARRPTTIAPSLEETSRSSLTAALEVADDDPVIVFLDAFNPRLDPPSGALEVAPGVRIADTFSEVPVGSPVAVSPAAASITGVSTPWSLAWVALAGLGLSFVIGSGWSWALVPTTWLGRLGVAPAFGAAILTLSATLADRSGVGFSRPGSLSIVFLSGSAGWLVALLLSGRRRRDPRSRTGSRHG